MAPVQIPLLIEFDRGVAEWSGAFIWSSKGGIDGDLNGDRWMGAYTYVDKNTVQFIQISSSQQQQQT